jgi:superfamily I DNA and RNA helicase
LCHHYLLFLIRVEDVLLSVTEEQYIIMSGIDVNDRMLIQGAAGTGKTLLAVEQCRKLESKGKKVLYLCYNRVIANYLRECLASEKLNIQISTLHEIMANYCSTLSGEKNSEYYQNILPEMFLKYTETGAWNDNSRFDAVIIDEGQDLMTTNYYWCINELIRKGFADGIWSIYFDPNQNIFNSNNELQDIWTQLKHDAASFSLSVLNLTFLRFNLTREWKLESLY